MRTRVFLLGFVFLLGSTCVHGQKHRWLPCPESWLCGTECCEGWCDTANNFTCVCPPGKEGPRCDIMTCNGQNKSNRHQWSPPYNWTVCTCDDNHMGENCLVPTHDEACKRGNASGVVDRTMNLHAHAEKLYHCNITEPSWVAILGGKGSLNFQCANMTTSASSGNRVGTCMVEVYEFHIDKMVPLFLVELFECISVIDVHSFVHVECDKTRAMCGNKASSDLCGDFLVKMLEGFTTKTSLDCKKDGKGDAHTECTFDQTDSQQLIPVTCYAGDCLAHPEPPPVPPKKHLSPFMIAGIVFLAVIVTGGVLYGIAFLVRRRREKAGYMLVDGEITEGDIIYETSGRPINGPLSATPCTVSFSELCYTLPSRTEPLLKGISGHVQPGQLMAIMGCSGAGKTTLLDCLARRKAAGSVEGTVLVNGDVVNDDVFRGVTGFVAQDDCLLGSLTVREAVTFSAMLRLPPKMSSREKKSRVEMVLRDLGISHVAASRIGTPSDRGISGGERRRVSIACELVTSPSVLFLDEPTSGLDSHTALSVVRTLNTLAQKNHTIICSIHQPSSQIVALFDKLVLLKSGEAMFSGQASAAVGFFEGTGHSCPPTFNPADFMIELVNEAEVSTVRAFKEHLASSFDGLNPRDPKRSASISLLSSRESAGWLRQTYYLCWRTAVNSWRNALLFRAHVVLMICVGLLIGCIYYKMGNDLIEVQNRVGVFFFICSLFAFSSMTALELFIKERPVFVFERANGYYHPSAYFVAKVIFDIVPLRVIPPLIFAGITYPMCGFVLTYDKFATYVFVIVLYNCVCTSQCLLIGTAIPSFSVANLVASLAILFSMLFGGFLLNKTNIPEYLDFLNYSSAFAYAFEILAINELHHFTMNFNPPGYPAQIVDADAIIVQFGLNADNFLRDFYILGGMCAGYLLIAYLVLHFFVKEQR